jgi:aspartyl-tRNA synthetase
MAPCSRQKRNDAAAQRTTANTNVQQMADANPHPSAATMTDEERAKVKEERERRKKEKEAEAAAKKAKQDAAAAAKTAGGGKADSAVADEDIVWPKVSYITPELPSEIFGDYVMVQSQGTTGRTWTRLQELDASKVGSLVWIRSRVHNARGKGNSCFLVLRSNMYTAQVAMFKSDSISKDFIKFCSCLSRESVVDVLGTIQAADVKSCTQSQIEIVPQRVYCVSRAYHMMPFTVDDVARSESEIAASEAKDIQTAYKRVGQDTRLDNRCIDLRAPAQNAIMRINSGVCDLWREACKANGFVEIHTPKMIAGASEGGAAVFKLQCVSSAFPSVIICNTLVRYFQQQACLAQSPQLYKQMSICSDFERVFEIGPVFRAETSNSHRHLTEFTGLDIEMEIKEHYFEALDMLEVILTHIFHGLQTQYAHEIDVASQQ